MGEETKHGLMDENKNGRVKEMQGMDYRDLRKQGRGGWILELRNGGEMDSVKKG